MDLHAYPHPLVFSYRMAAVDSGHVRGWLLAKAVSQKAGLSGKTSTEKLSPTVPGVRDDVKQLSLVLFAHTGVSHFCMLSIGEPIF